MTTDPAPNYISIRSDLDIIAARMAAREMARKMGFSTIDQARIATAASELARTVLINAGEGNVTIWQRRPDDRCAIELVFENLHLVEASVAALSGNHETALSGLAAVRRLMDEIEIVTNPGDDTTIVCRKWQRHAGT